MDEESVQVEEIFAQVDLDPGQVNLLLSSLKPVNHSDDEVGKFESVTNDNDDLGSGKPATLYLRNDVTRQEPISNHCYLYQPTKTQLLEHPVCYLSNNPPIRTQDHTGAPVKNNFNKEHKTSSHEEKSVNNISHQQAGRSGDCQNQGNRLILNISPLLRPTPPPPSSNISLQKCCRCDFFSLCREGLEKHESAEHPPPRPTIQCISCSNVFLSLQSLKVHLLLDHEVLKSELTDILLLTLRKCEEFLQSNNTSGSTKKVTRKEDYTSKDQSSNNVSIELPPSLLDRTHPPLPLKYPKPLISTSNISSESSNFNDMTSSSLKSYTKSKVSTSFHRKGSNSIYNRFLESTNQTIPSSQSNSKSLDNVVLDDSESMSPNFPVETVKETLASLDAEPLSNSSVKSLDLSQSFDPANPHLALPRASNLDNWSGDPMDYIDISDDSLDKNTLMNLVSEMLPETSPCEFGLENELELVTDKQSPVPLSQGFNAEEEDEYSDTDDSDIISLSSQPDSDEAITKHLQLLLQLKKDKFKAPRCLLSNCNIRFKSVNTMSYHKKCHDKDSSKGWMCPECRKSWTSWHSLSLHLWNDHSIDMELYYCNFCSFRTPNLSHLKTSHIWIHGKGKTFNCPTCEKSFKTSKQMRNHQVMHKKNGVRYECKGCKALFSRCHLLRQHYDAVHQKVRKFKCETCGHRSASQSAHSLHLRKHTKEKKYKCGECNYSTGDHNALRRHLATHSGVRPYSCPHCAYASISSKSLLSHVSSKHPGMLGDVVFSCPLCPFKTLRKQIFVSHAAKHNLTQTPLNAAAIQVSSSSDV